jgi:hypothetical protein
MSKGSGRRILWGAGAILVIATVTELVLRFLPRDPGYDRLIGRWQRPDGGYIIEIVAVDAEGKVDAAYFNPSPINVSMARASVRDRRLELYVELKDRSYPGNYYTLNYDAETDRLVGVYHHLGIGQNFTVEFLRLKTP